MWILTIVLPVVGLFSGFLTASVISARRISELYVQTQWWRWRYEQLCHTAMSQPADLPSSIRFN